MDFSIEKTQDLIHYKIGYKLKDLLKHKNHPNIIIVGLSNSGKTKLVFTVFKEVFGETRLVKYGVFNFLENRNYYIFDFLKYVKYDIIKLIKEIVNNYDHYNGNVKYIIIDNFKDIPRNLQVSIKVLIERASMNSRFIFITNHYGNIENSLKGNCLKIVIPIPSVYDKFIYLKNIFTNKVFYNDFLLFEDCKKLDLEVIINKYNLDCTYINIYNDFCYNYIDFLVSEFDIFILRELIIKMKSINIKLNLLLEILIDKLIPIIGDIQMIIVIKEIANYNYIINKSYRDIVPLESLFIRLYQIINYGELL